MRNTIQIFLRKRGYEITRYPVGDLERRLRTMRFYGIDLLFDVGANFGRYGLDMRQLGYSNRIVSFEPLKEVFAELKESAAHDEKWEAYAYALGDQNEKRAINIAGNLDSSSFLDMLPEHLESAPESKYVAQEDVEVKTLDSIFRNFYSEGDNVMLKMDTQGFEMSILNGAEESLNHIRVIQLEMSLIPLYKGETLYLDMIDFMRNKGFSLHSLENGFSNPDSGQLLQVNGIFTSMNSHK